MIDVISELEKSEGNKVLEILIVGDDITGKFWDIDYLVALDYDINLFHVVSFADRPGFNRFQVRLEHEYFPPMSEREKLLRYFLLKWEGMIYAVLTMPFKERHCCFEAAENTNMRLADGVPNSIDSDGVKVFPLSSERVYTIENSKDSIVYEGVGGQKDEKALERFQINQFLKSKGLIEDEDEDDPWKESE